MLVEKNNRNLEIEKILDELEIEIEPTESKVSEKDEKENSKAM